MEITIRIVFSRVILAAAAGCALLTAALACGGGGNSANTPTAAQSQSSSSAATATATATDAATEQAASSTTASSNISASGPLAVCPLITQDEIVAIVGQINAGLPNSISPTEYACEWHAAPEPYVAQVGVGVHLNTTDGARAYFQVTSGGDEAGVGDGARWDASQTTLHVLKGKYVLDISALGLPSVSASLAAAEAIAQAMMPRLP
jgi:hypothetical protein